MSAEDLEDFLRSYEGGSASESAPSYKPAVLSHSELQKHELVLLAERRWRNRLPRHVDLEAFLRRTASERRSAALASEEALESRRAKLARLCQTRRDGASSMDSASVSALEEEVLRLRETIAREERKAESARRMADEADAAASRHRKAALNYPAPEDEEAVAALVSEVYVHLRNSGFSGGALQALEHSHYLELFLWPSFCGAEAPGEETSKNETSKKETSKEERRLRGTTQPAHLLSLCALLLANPRKGGGLLHPLQKQPRELAAMGHLQTTVDGAEESSSASEEQAVAASSAAEEEMPAEFFAAKIKSFFYRAALLLLTAELPPEAAFARLEEQKKGAPRGHGEEGVGEREDDGDFASDAGSGTRQDASKKAFRADAKAQPLLGEERVLLSCDELRLLVSFFVEASQGLEDALLRRMVLSLCGGACLARLSRRSLEAQLESGKAASVLWRRAEKHLRPLKQLENAAAKASAETEEVLQRIVASPAQREALLELQMDRDFVFVLVRKLFFLAEDVCGAFPSKSVPVSLILLIERLTELLLDLLQQLPTRRCVLTLFREMQCVVRLNRSAAAHCSEAAVFRQLLHSLEFYDRFQVDDDSGAPLGPVEVLLKECRHLESFQRFCFEKSREEGGAAETEAESEERKSFAQAALEPAVLARDVERMQKFLSTKSLVSLVELCAEMNLADPALLPGVPDSEEKLADAAAVALQARALRAACGLNPRRKKGWVRGLLVDVLLYAMRRQPDQLEQINGESLYPDEMELWSETFVPPPHQLLQHQTLPLPKLNLQFLTVHDYLLRNFRLFRLEATHEIKEEIEDALWRMQPVRGAGRNAVAVAYPGVSASHLPRGSLKNERTLRPEDYIGGETRFEGSCRMALPIQRYTVVSVDPPRVGERVPAAVRAEIVIDLHSCEPQVRREWDGLREHDVVFSLAVSAPLHPMQNRPSDRQPPSSIREGFGILAVRGAEIVEVLDAEGSNISEPNPFKPVNPVGSLRTLRVRLDPCAYSRDLAQLRDDGAATLHSQMNLLMRRSPRVNSFKAVLETIRGLMNNPSEAVVPKWLHDIFLGYGDPRGCTYTRMPSSALPVLDLRDTFVDVHHIAEALPNAASLEVPSDVPPGAYFRLEFRPSSQAATQANTPAPQSEPEASDFTRAHIRAVPYTLPSNGPYHECARKRNVVRFTPAQVRALISGLQPGVTLVLGPPGSGKTDTAAQLANLLYHCHPTEKTLLVAHSNAALNDLFRKVAALDVDETHMLRLGRGSLDLQDHLEHMRKRREELQSEQGEALLPPREGTDEVEDFSYSKHGRVNRILEFRKQLLSRVERLGEAVQKELLQVAKSAAAAGGVAGVSTVGDVGSSCEAALQFFRQHVQLRVRRYLRALDAVVAVQTQQRDGELDADAAREALSVIVKRFQDERGANIEVAVNGRAPATEAQASAASSSPEESAVSQKRSRETAGGGAGDDRPKRRPTQAAGSAGREETDAISISSDSEETQGVNSQPDAQQQESPAAQTAGEEPTTRSSASPGERLLVDPVTAHFAHGMSFAEALFPFADFFSDAPLPLFPRGGVSSEREAQARLVVEACIRFLRDMKRQLKVFRAFELLRTTGDRTNFLLTTHARMIAMTCTHAAITRQNLVTLGFTFDSLIIEEAAQILEVETFIPMLLQKARGGCCRLKRVILIGDHHQLPPIIRQPALDRFSHFEQSLYERFVRLGVPFVCLDSQGRARPSIAALYSWRYQRLGNLPIVETSAVFRVPNPGFAFDFQFVNVPKYKGFGESCPIPHFYQNLGEAEFVVAVFMYMRMLGYPRERISILTTYNGQVALLSDVLERRCRWNPAIGMPKAVSTVDKYQGQQNDYILLSLVRTERPGHLRDVRRLIVAVSRARLGLYIFGRWSLFSNCASLLPVFTQLAQRPRVLNVHPKEDDFRKTLADSTAALAEDALPPERGQVVKVATVDEMQQIVRTLAATKVEQFKKQLMMAAPSAPPPDPRAEIQKEAEEIMRRAEEVQVRDVPGTSALGAASLVKASAEVAESDNECWSPDKTEGKRRRQEAEAPVASHTAGDA